MTETTDAHKVTTPPASEPVTIDEVKAHLRLDTTADNELIEDQLIPAAREYCEMVTRRAFVTQTWTLMMNAWGQRADLEWWDGVREGSILGDLPAFVELPGSPLASVTSVSTFAADNTETTFSADNYYVDTFSTPGRIALNPGVVWPTAGRNYHGIKIVYVVGYGDATDVPFALRQAVIQLAAHWYENRESIREIGTAGGDVMVPKGFDNILRRYKVMRL